MGRVRIGTCLSPGEAALMRSILSAHGIHAIVSAELAALGSTSLSNDLWVADEDREDAATLLRDLGAGPGAVADAAGEDDADGDGDDDADAGADHHDTHASLQQRHDRRRRTAVALLLGVCVTFGTAHMFTRAWLRGIALAGLETIGFIQLYAGRPARVLVVAAIAVDLIGALWRIWAAPRSTLPVARVVN